MAREFTAPEVPTSKVEELQTMLFLKELGKPRTKSKASRRREEIKDKSRNKNVLHF